MNPLTLLTVRGWLIVAAAALLIGLGAFGAWKWQDGRVKAAQEAVQALQGQVDALQHAAAAKAVADAQRATDDASNRKLSEDLTNAVAKLPDGTPSARRIARGCIELRRAKIDTSKLPQCVGTTG